MFKPIVAVVDDESEILELYEAYLGGRFDVRIFDSPIKFLEALENDKTLVLGTVITDLNMPKMDGVQMVAKARAMGFNFPFIILSGHLSKEKVAEAQCLGVFRLLEKPIEFDALEGIVAKWITDNQAHH
jgi:DNA-binding NtrC family response regulator